MAKLIGPLTRYQQTQKSAKEAFGSDAYKTGARLNRKVSGLPSPLKSFETAKPKETKAFATRKSVAAPSKPKGAEFEVGYTKIKSKPQMRAAGKAAKTREKGIEALEQGKLNKAKRLSRRYQRQKGKM